MRGSANRLSGGWLLPAGQRLVSPVPDETLLAFYGDNENVAQLVRQIPWGLRDHVAEYALRDLNKPIGVSRYELSATLPEELRASLQVEQGLSDEKQQKSRE